MHPQPFAAETDRNFDILLAFPFQLESQAVGWALASHGGIQRVRHLAGGEDLLSQIRAESPRVVLLSEEVAISSLSQVARQVAVRLKECLVGVFVDRLSARQLDMVAQRATGLFSRQSSLTSFVSSLERLASGRKVLDRTLENRVRLNGHDEFIVESVDQIARLTDRQLDVLVRIAEGKSVKEVAQDLHISAKAVESHKYRLMRTLEMNDRVRLCRWAIREGIIQP